MKKILLHLILLSLSFNVYSKDSNHIAAIVGDDAISTSDVYNRIDLSMSMMNVEKNQTNANKLLSKVMQQLIDEKLLASEAKIMKIDVSEEEISEHITEIESQTADNTNFKQWLKDNHIDLNTAIDQIRSQILWNKILAIKIRPKVTVSQEEIEQVSNMSKPKYNKIEFKQILVSLDDIQSENNLKTKTTELNNLGNFARDCGDLQLEAKKIDSSFDVDSISLPLDQIHPDLQDIIRNLPINKLSKTIKSNDSIRVIMVCNKDVEGYDTQSKEEINYNLMTKKIQTEAGYYLSNLRKKTYIEVLI